jgi:hypothetical protein
MFRVRHAGQEMAMASHDLVEVEIVALPVLRPDRPTLQDLRPLTLAEQVEEPLIRELPRDAWKRIGGGAPVFRPEHLLRMRADGLRDYCGRVSDRDSLGSRKEFDLSDTPCPDCAAAVELEDDVTAESDALELGGEA